jgi:hypothetical protein
VRPGRARIFPPALPLSLFYELALCLSLSIVLFVSSHLSMFSLVFFSGQQLLVGVVIPFSFLFAFKFLLISSAELIILL